MRTYEEQTALILNKVNQHKIAKKKRIRMAYSLSVAFVIFASISGLAFARFGNLDLGSIFNSFFNNSAVEHRIDVGHTASEGGLELTLLSVFSDSHRAYLMIELKDFEGKRLSDSMAVLSHNNSAIGVESVIFDDAENKATMILSMLLARGVNEGDVINFQIDAVFSNFVGELDHIDFDFEKNDHFAWMMYFQGNRYEHTILGPWELSFTASAVIPSKKITVTPTGSQYLAMLQIECSPMATTVVAYSPRSRAVGGDVIDPADVYLDSTDTEAIDAWNSYVFELNAYMRSMIDYIYSFGAPYLTLKDGSVIPLVLTSSGFGDGSGEATYFGGYFDVQELHTITFCGEAYAFSDNGGDSHND